jgi:hypothetical protein
MSSRGAAAGLNASFLSGLEAAQPVGVIGEFSRPHFDRDFAAEAR